MSGLWRYDDFEPGRVVGEASEAVAPGMARSWQAIFGTDGAGGAAEGASLALVVMMRAYCRAVAPRPPGNVHARQRFAVAATPRVGETVHTVVRCVGKEIKRERRYVELETAGTGEAGRALFTGTMTLVWAI